MTAGGIAPFDETMPPDWSLALEAGLLFAIDPPACGGILLRARHSALRERWLGWLLGLLPPDAPRCRVPLQVSDDRLLGGLDLSATLASGRTVVERGLLAQADGGVVLLPSAERMLPGTALRIAAAYDNRQVILERDGLTRRFDTRFGLLAIDESIEDDEQAPPAIADRCALHVDLDRIAARGLDAIALPQPGVDALAEAGRRAAAMPADAALLDTLLRVAEALGVASLRRCHAALVATRLAAARAGRERPAEADVARAVALVFAPVATRWPMPPDAAPGQDAPPEPPPADAAPPPAADRQDEPPPPRPPAGEAPGRDDPPPPPPTPPPPPRPSEPPAAAAPRDGEDDDGSDAAGAAERVIAAVRAALPPDLLGRLHAARLRLKGGGGEGGRNRRSAASIVRIGGGSRGRRAGSLAPPSLRAARLNLLETLRAAAPHQAARRRALVASAAAASPRRVLVRKADLRVDRRILTPRTTIVFVVDASGSSALHRLAEAKGAVELLLADCYVRRDRVALVAFRDRRAELLLPPTRSLARTRRSLAALPGGGGTPLASAIAAALALAAAIRRQQGLPMLVFMTDGQANVASDGTPGRTRATSDAYDAAARLRASGWPTLLIDTAPRPQASAQRLAQAMGARYQPLPVARAGQVSQAVRAAIGALH